MPPGSLVPRDWVLEQLVRSDPVLEHPGATAGGLVDLNISDLAKLFGKRPSTVRAWVERGDFPGAYKLHHKEWRVPAKSVEAFQTRQHRQSTSALSAWRGSGQASA